MKVMISQPMRGKTNEQIRKERAEVVKQLEEQGYEVVDTIFENAPQGLDKGRDQAIYYLGSSIQYIALVDAVVFMQGWEKARGCKIEYLVAKNYGKFIKIV